MIFIVLGLAGCSSFSIIGVAIGLGFWLDALFENAYHLFTIIFVLLSVPITGAALLWVVRFVTGRFKVPGQAESAEENS